MENNNLMAIVTDSSRMPSKAEIATKVKELQARYEQGGLGVNPLKDYVTLKAIECFIKDALKACEGWAVQAAKNYSDNERKSLYGAKVTLKESGAKYDYSENSEWVQYSDEEKAYEEQMKQAATMRKAIEENMRAAGTAKKETESKTSISITLL